MTQMLDCSGSPQPTTPGGHRGAEGPRDRRQRPPRDGAGRPLAALHRAGVRPRRADRPHRAHARHAGAGEEPHDAAPRRGAAAADRRPQDRLAGRARVGLRRRRGQRLGRGVDDPGHGRRGPRPRRDVPEPRPVRPRPRLRRAHRVRRPRAGLRHRHRPGLQRLAGRLLQGVTRAHVRRRHGRAARRRGRRARGPPLRRGARLQGRLPVAGLREQPPVAPPRLRPAVGGDPAPRRAAVVPRRRADLPHAGLLAAGPRQADAVARVQPAARHPVRHGEPVRRRRARALPEPARARCSRATAPGRRGCSTGSTSTTSGPAGTRPPTSR